MKYLLVIFLSSLSLVGIAQTAETKYYRKKPFREEVPQSEAKFSKTITKENGTVTTTTRNLKKGQIEYQEAWKGDEPVGAWVIGLMSGTEELDYNFELAYAEKGCSNDEVLQGITDFFKDNDAAGYAAPSIDYKDGNIFTFIGHSLRYPSNARRGGIEGTVEVAFTITKEGSIQDIVVAKGTHITLDKEAVRVIRKLKLSSAPQVNGKGQEVCVKMPIRFRLG